MVAASSLMGTNRRESAESYSIIRVLLVAYAQEPAQAFLGALFT
jgi:hypothetical protein